MGCFLLIDWIVHIQELLNGTTVLEIGAGTGLASIAINLLIAVDCIYCTGETSCSFLAFNPYLCPCKHAQGQETDSFFVLLM